MVKSSVIHYERDARQNGISFFYVVRGKNNMHTNVRLWVKATCGPLAKTYQSFNVQQSLQHDVDGQIRIMEVLA